MPRPAAYHLRSDLFFRFLFLLVLLISFFCSYAKLQSYSIYIKHVTLLQAIRVIEKSTGYSFIYTIEDIQANPVNVDVEATNSSIADILTQCFKSTSLSYVIESNRIIVKKKEERVLNQSFFEVGKISGQVLDENGRPLKDATIGVKGGTENTVSGNDGGFKLQIKHFEDFTLVFSLIGYQTREIKIVDQKYIVVNLKSGESILDDVEVVAYGKNSNRFKTNNSGGIKAEDIEKQPVNNPLLALEGRVPGILITQATGVPGSAVKVRIQGATSLLAGVEPFYVIDGVPYSSTLLPSTYSGTAQGTSSGSLNMAGAGGNPLSYINPNDIESIEVLKDADATSIYGARAANGAILITTKKGKSGVARFDMNVKYGRGKVSRRVNVLNTQQFLMMRHEALKNDNLSVGVADYDLNGTWDSTRNTNWQNVLFGKPAQDFNTQFSVSGGNVNTKYLASASYIRQTTVTPGDFADQKASLLFNLSTNSNNQKFNMQFSTSYMYDDNRIQSIDIGQLALTLSPTAPAIYNPDGTLNWAYSKSGSVTWPGGNNPFALLNRKVKIKTNNIVNNLVLSYVVLPGIDVRVSGGYTNLQSNEAYTNPSSSQTPVYVRTYGNLSRQAFFSNTLIESYVVEPQLAMNKRLFKGGRLNALLGGTFQWNSSEGKSINGTNYLSDDLLGSVYAAGSVSVLNVVSSQYKYNAIFGNVNYNLNEKYILNLTMRRDGSSRFGTDNRFHNFGAVGVAWIFNREHFLHLPAILSFGKLKGSYGITGNDQIGNYTYLDLYQSYGVGVAYQGIPALITQGLYNPKLQWEQTRKLNVGIDLGFLNNRILIGANYAINRSSNLIKSVGLSSVAGITSVLTNFPGLIQNTSLEFTLTTDNIKRRNFSWSTSFNATVPRQKLVSYPIESNFTLTSILGYPLSAFRAYQYGGVDPQTGIDMIVDAKGNLTNNPSSKTDLTRIVQTEPPFYCGLENRFKYKGLKLDIFLQVVKQKSPIYRFNVNGTYPGTRGQNQSVDVLNRWQKPGDITNMPRFSTLSGDNYFFFQSSANYVDASYIRVKNVSLSWDLPSSWLTRSGIKGATFAAQMQNLFTITRYTGLDPESGFSGIPPLQSIVISAQIHL